MKIAITLNEVLRTFTNDFFEKVYDNNYKFEEKEVKYMNEGEGEEHEIVEKFQYVDLTGLSEDEIENNLEALEWKELDHKKEKNFLNLDKKIDPWQLTKDFYFESEEDFEDFTYYNSAFTLFGKSDAKYRTVFLDFNILQSLIYEQSHTLTLISQEIGNSKSASLYFLAKNQYTGNKILFLENYSQIWNEFDLIITANPYLLEIKPKNKLAIKIECEKNINCQADLTFKTLKEFKDYYLINKE